MDGRVVNVSSGYVIHVVLQNGIEIVRNVKAIMKIKN